MDEGLKGNGLFFILSSTTDGVDFRKQTTHAALGESHALKSLYEWDSVLRTGTPIRWVTAYIFALYVYFDSSRVQCTYNVYRA